MTKAQALKWARQQWGERANVVRKAPLTAIAKGGPMKGREFITRHAYLVGVRDRSVFGSGLTYYGHGPTWDAAVESARDALSRGRGSRGFTTGA